MVQQTDKCKMKQIQHCVGVFALVVLLLLLPFCLRAAPSHVKPAMQSLTRSLRTTAVPILAYWRKMLAAHVQAEAIPEKPGKWFRVPQGFVGDIQRVTVERRSDKAAPYRGVVVLNMTWKTPFALEFKSQGEALSAELTEDEPGQLYLLFVYQQGKWRYLRGTEKPPTSADWKPREKSDAPDSPDVSTMSL